MTNIDDLITGPSPRPRGSADGLAITPERMTDALAAELVQELDLGDWEPIDWEANFIDSCLSRSTFSVKQRAVIYKLARRFNLL